MGDFGRLALAMPAKGWAQSDAADRVLTESGVLMIVSKILMLERVCAELNIPEIR